MMPADQMMKYRGGIIFFALVLELLSSAGGSPGSATAPTLLLRGAESALAAGAHHLNVALRMRSLRGGQGSALEREGPRVTRATQPATFHDVLCRPL